MWKLKTQLRENSLTVSTSKFHLTPQGDVYSCNAKKNECPYGSEAHFATKEAAREFFEEAQESSFSNDLEGPSEATKAALESPLEWIGPKPKWFKKLEKEKGPFSDSKISLIGKIPSPEGDLAVIWENDSRADNDVSIEVDRGYEISRVTINDLETGKQVGYLKMGSMNQESIERSFGADEWQEFAWASDALGGNYGFRRYKNDGVEVPIRAKDPQKVLEAKKHLWAQSHASMQKTPQDFDRSVLPWGGLVNLKEEHAPADEKLLDRDIDVLRKELRIQMVAQRDWHSDPTIDYIRIEENLKGAGLGHALYVFGARMQAKSGRVLRASGIQSPEARRSWARMKRVGLPVKTIQKPESYIGESEMRDYLTLDFRN